MERGRPGLARRGRLVPGPEIRETRGPPGWRLPRMG